MSNKRPMKSKLIKIHNSTKSAQNEGKVYIIEYLPEWAISKDSLLRIKFQKKLKEILEDKRGSTKYVLMSNNPNEHTEYYMQRVFGKEITRRAYFKEIKFNPVTEKALLTKLKEICNLEGYEVDASVLEGIIKSSNQDVRNSLLTLQMHFVTLRSKMNSSKNKRKKYDSADILINETQNFDKFAKDSLLGIFHAVGKFMYNKRIDPDDPTKIRQFDEYIMRSKNPPKLYFSPEEVIDTCGESYEKFKEYFFCSF